MKILRGHAFAVLCVLKALDLLCQCVLVEVPLSPWYWLHCGNVTTMGVTLSNPVGAHHSCNLQPFIQFKRCMSLKDLAVYFCRVENGLSCFGCSCLQTDSCQPGVIVTATCHPCSRVSTVRESHVTYNVRPVSLSYNSLPC